MCLVFEMFGVFFSRPCSRLTSWGSSVSIVTWLRTERSGFESGQGQEVFLYFRTSRLALWATKPPIQRVPGFFSPGIKRPEGSTDHSRPSSAKVENEWSYTSTVPLRSVDGENFVPYSRQKCRGGGCVHGLPQTFCTAIQKDLFMHSQCSCQ